MKSCYDTANLKKKGGGMTLVIFLALSLMQVDQPLSHDEIMHKAVVKSAADAQILKERYVFERIGTGKKKTWCSNPADTNMSIGDLFGSERYIYALADETFLFNSRPMYVINFSPKPDKQPKAPGGASFCTKVKNDILNHLFGVLYVDQEDFGIARVITHVHKPVARIVGVGRLYKMEATFTQFRLDEVWAPEEITTDSEFSYFLGIRHSRDNPTIQFQNYQLRPPGE